MYTLYLERNRALQSLGYVHTVTFSHRFLLFGSKLEFPWDCGTIQSHAKTLPCARSLRFHFCDTHIIVVAFGDTAYTTEMANRVADQNAHLHWRSTKFLLTFVSWLLTGSNWDNYIFTLFSRTANRSSFWMTSHTSKHAVKSEILLECSCHSSSQWCLSNIR